MRQELMRLEPVISRFRTAFLAVTDGRLSRNHVTIFPKACSEHGFKTSVALRQRRFMRYIKSGGAAPHRLNNVSASAGRPSRDTALIDGSAVEGHVPAPDKKYLFAQRPVATDVSGPGMAALFGSGS